MWRVWSLISEAQIRAAQLTTLLLDRDASGRYYAGSLEAVAVLVIKKHVRLEGGQYR
jgi:hypothetical protein